MALAQQVLSSARTHINDDDALQWPDPRIFPKLQEAQREMLLVMLQNDVPVIHEVNPIMTVPAVTIDDDNLDLSTVAGYPQDMMVPIWLKERNVGQNQTDFVDMKACDFIPQVQLSNDQLIWWAWMSNPTLGVPISGASSQTIMLRGCLTPVQVMIRYKRLIPFPQTNLDDLVVTLGETYLSYRTAALCMSSIRDFDFAKVLNGPAATNLEALVGIAVKQLQALPAKRGPYHRGRGRNRVLRDF